MGRISKFLLWFLTFGIFGLGTLIDLFTIGSAVDAYNVNQELKTMRACQTKNN
jgi:sulfite exporter TauE/SafE